ncbi:MFS transporter [Arthrobacter sp. UYEF20]|uniref:MFS transporter n=1 Tax=Arthrobacter sp. UYEF20 TaxID=1756363 RepID=UPI00339368CE
MSTVTRASRHAGLEDGSLTPFHRKLTVYSSGGPFLDGYIMSIIGVAMLQISDYMHLSVVWEGVIGASALVGIFLGGFVGGWLSDRFGRQVLYTLDLVAIIVCSVLQFWVEGPWMLLLLRVGVGIAVGADYPIATTLLTEFLPRRHRGPAISFLMIMWFLGAAVAYVVGEWISGLGGESWRWMLASAALPALVIVCLRHGAPESPRWLIQKGRLAEAEVVLKKVFGPSANINELEEQQGGSVRARDLLKSGYLGRVAFVTTFWTCSIVPLFAVYAFGPRILQSMGFDEDSAKTGTAAINFLFLAGCLICAVFINRSGRRKLVIHSFLWSGAALVILGLFPGAPGPVILVLFASYAIAIGGAQILQFVYPNELFPTSIRGSAVGLASSLSRIGAAAGTYLVPVMLSDLGIGPTMLIAAGITVLGLLVCLKWAPETKDLDLSAAARLK